MSTVDDLGIAHADTTDSAVALFNRRAPRISQADVFRAADELLLDGHRPTIDRVRMRLGRGSPNTINDHLDVWWAKLGARLRDVPGHDFPQLPERIARTLQQLWNEALDGAREALQSALREREQALAQRDQVLEDRARQLLEREQTSAARTGALEESITLAREQLAAANQRAQALERNMQERDTEAARLRSRAETFEADCANWRTKLDAANSAHHDERIQLQERHAAAESHWLLEVDRTRQHAKDEAKQHEQQTKELRRRIDGLTNERDQLRQNLLEVGAELKTAAAVREQLEERLRVASRAAPEQAQAVATRSKTKRSRRPAARRGTDSSNSGTPK
jgi:hypothetical protein